MFKFGWDCFRFLTMRPQRAKQHIYNNLIIKNLKEPQKSQVTEQVIILKMSLMTCTKIKKIEIRLLTRLL